MANNKLEKDHAAGVKAKVISLVDRQVITLMFDKESF